MEQGQGRGHDRARAVVCRVLRVGETNAPFWRKSCSVGIPLIPRNSVPFQSKSRAGSVGTQPTACLGWCGISHKIIYMVQVKVKIHALFHGPGDPGNVESRRN